MYRESVRGLSASVAAVLVVGLGVSCQSRPERVFIGIALSRQTHPAVEMAAAEINSAGGIDGARVELLGLDWQFEDELAPADVLQWAQRFVETRGLVAVVGHSDSSSTLTAGPFYNQRGVPLIVTIATNPAITNMGDWTYRLCLSDAKQGPALADYAVHHWKKNRIAVFYVNDDYGRGLARLFEEEVRLVGGTIVSSVMHRNVLREDDKELIRSTVTQLQWQRDPDLFVLFQRPEAAQWTIRTIRSLGSRADILGGDSLGTSELLGAQPQLLEGIRVSHFFLPDTENPRSLEFVRRFRELTRSEPNYGHAFAYDAVHLVADAVKEGGFSRRGVKSYLDRLIHEREPISSVGGTYSLGPDHDGRRSLYIAEAREGRYQLLTSLPAN